MSCCCCEAKGVDFGKVTAGNAKLYVLKLGEASVALTNFGARIVSIVVPDKDGKYADVALGYDTAAEYENQGGSLGAFVGRCANRLAGADFVLNGKRYAVSENKKGYSIHGGFVGFGKRLWNAEPVQCDCAGDNCAAIRFTYRSPDGEEGYPGNLDVSATYTLTREESSGAIELRLDMDATCDADTVANFTNHVYFNLVRHDYGVTGEGAEKTGGILSHKLKLESHFFTPSDETLCPTGEIAPTTGALDFSKPRVIGQDIECDDPRLVAAGGYDHNYVLDKAERGALELAATLDCPETGRRLEMFTTLPGVQFYTSNNLSPRKGKNGAQYASFQGVCLEPQLFPNAMKCSHFPTPVLRKGQKYHHVVVWRFTAGAY